MSNDESTATELDITTKDGIDVAVGRTVVRDGE